MRPAPDASRGGEFLAQPPVEFEEVLDAIRRRGIRQNPRLERPQLLQDLLKGMIGVEVFVLMAFAARAGRNRRQAKGQIALDGAVEEIGDSHSGESSRRFDEIMASSGFREKVQSGRALGQALIGDRAREWKNGRNGNWGRDGNFYPFFPILPIISIIPPIIPIPLLTSALYVIYANNQGGGDKLKGAFFSDWL